MGLQARILWIEDSARYELSELLAPVYHARIYHVKLAEDATTAMQYLVNNHTDFDVIIIDIRLPPGSDRSWQKHYQKARSSKVNGQLGLLILNWLLDSRQSDYASISAAPPAIPIEKVAVFTVESKTQIGDELDQLGILFYEQKKAAQPDTILLDLIERVLNHKSYTPRTRGI